MDNTEKNRLFRNFLKDHTFATISTVSPQQKPESATVEYFLLDEGLDVVFRTQTNFRKYKNLKQNPAVALQIRAQETSTLQYEGMAQEIALDSLSVNEKIAIASRSISGRVIYEEDKGVYFRIKPTWIRLTDVSKQPWEEVTLVVK
ncbi:MAG TPA: pyridoxamine 5'-phosphate oxidase family protein [Candidatus Gracilibacteria bacterium]